MNYHLAQINVARLHHPLDHAQTAEFVAALDPINALAEASPGFVWRLTDEDGQSSSYVSVSDDPLFLINYSVWETAEDLRAFVYQTEHRDYLRRRREWFQAMDVPITACWWIPAGIIPTVEHALARLEQLRTHGPSDRVFPFKPPFPSPPQTRQLTG